MIGLDTQRFGAARVLCQACSKTALLILRARQFRAQSIRAPAANQAPSRRRSASVISVRLPAGMVWRTTATSLIFAAQRRPAVAAKLERAAAGASLNRAQRALDDIARFEGD